MSEKPGFFRRTLQRIVGVPLARRWLASDKVSFTLDAEVVRKNSK